MRDERAQTDKNPVHAYVSDKAERVLSFLTESTGVSKTGLIQAWLESFHVAFEANGWDEGCVDDVVGTPFIRSARRVDTSKRKRTSRS